MSVDFIFHLTYSVVYRGLYKSDTLDLFTCLLPLYFLKKILWTYSLQTVYEDRRGFMPTHFGRELSQRKPLILRRYVACINTNQRKIPAEDTPMAMLQSPRGTPEGLPVNDR